MRSYEEFLAHKLRTDVSTGITDDVDINPMLFPFQRDIVRWALKRGRAAIFADCGLGKTPMQLEWAKHIEGPVLILAPLAVAQQTKREGEKFGILVDVVRKHSDRCGKIGVTNYEMMEHFDLDAFAGIVLDESSILKAYDGKTRTEIIDKAGRVPFRLACTATPAPNDYMELGNHAEFLGAMTRTEMLSTFFVHDGGETSKWRLKGHAQAEFWRWVCQWAVMLRKPSDLGYEDEGFTLPPMVMHEHSLRVETPTDGFLFPVEASTLQERLRARRDTIDDRVAEAERIISASWINSKSAEAATPASDSSKTVPRDYDVPLHTLMPQWIVWTNLNDEGNAIERLIPGSVQVSGSDSLEFKERAVRDFQNGDIRVLISKPSIFGFGLNLQCCHNMAFIGLSDSYEAFYQSLRRVWRFGQTNPVNVHIITAETEGAVVANIKRKEADAMAMAASMVANMHDINSAEIHGATVRKMDTYATEQNGGTGWTAYLGDCVEGVKAMADESVDYSVFSPPFASLYTYSASDRDMGNCRDDESFIEHYGFLVKDLFRVLKPGRLLSFHCMNLPTSKQHHGVIGVRDFRGELIRLHEAAGFIFHSEVCIWKDPVTAMQRTKALGLLHKQIKKDSCMSRQGIPDYLVTMRKPGVNLEPVSHTAEDFPVQLWQNYASPVWMDINPSNTLQFRSAREHNDERHICPLQLEVIRRALKLWTNPGDLVLSPFMGIGSEGYCALEAGRRFVGYELKRSYYEQACRNLDAALSAQGTLLESA